MAYKRLNVGSICKRKDGNGKHIKISNDVTLKKGDYLNVESKAEQLASLNEAAANGKISEANAEKARERLEKMPDWVVAEVYQLSKT